MSSDLPNKTVDRLKAILRSLGLPVSGNKSELIERIRQASRTMLHYEDIKGLDPLIEWAKMTGRLFSPRAVTFGFPRFPTGVLLTGVPGCGKSMVAKAISNEWRMGFLRVHPDNLVGACVGDNEKYMRNLVNQLVRNAPIICFIDEAEKILGQTRGPGGSQYKAADAARDSAESILLQFMEDDLSGVFFIFTANDYDKLSPALIDRFQGRFFIDLPSSPARKQIISSMLEIRLRDPADYEIEKLVSMSHGFSGRDIRTAVDEAMKIAFFEGARPITQSDFVTTFSQTVPTSKTHEHQITRMREMVSEGKMRRANSEELDEQVRVPKEGVLMEWA